MKKDLYDIADMPAEGHVPPRMHAFTVRSNRLGAPATSLKREIVDTPALADDDVLVYVMASGVNYANIWAATGVPLDVIAARRKAGANEDFHIGGSDASGIVWATGNNVTTVKPGDEVVVFCGTWDESCPTIKDGGDPTYSPTFGIWGYDTNYGSFAQFTRVKGHQCLPKPRHLTWEAAAAYMHVGATAYRMLLGFSPNVLKRDDVVLIWGGAGGLGSMAIQIARAYDAIPVAVVSSEDKFDYCKQLGAKGVINRNDFDHWGVLPHWRDEIGYESWQRGVRRFGEAIWRAVGDRRNPNIVFEHPGESTIPTSIFVCARGGMVVVCAGTTGYNASVDLRYLWTRQKRLQGSHYANDVQAAGFNNLVREGEVDPCLSRTFTFDETPDAHQLMYENRHPYGNMAVLVGAKAKGLGAVETGSTPAMRVRPQSNVGERRVSQEFLLPFVGTAPQYDDAEGEMLPRPKSTPAHDPTPVEKVMNRGIIACALESSVEEIALIMLEHGIHALVVMAKDEPVGFISQTDLVLARSGRTPEDARKLTAREIMTPGCLTCETTTTLSDAITLMTRKRVNRLVVLANDGHHKKAVGVLSMTDIVRKTLSVQQE